MDSVKSESDGKLFPIKLEEVHTSSLVHPGFNAQPGIEGSSVTQSPLCPAPICRQFWKAGNYYDEFVPKSRVQSGNSYLHVHPKFLHSNATSHKWAFGALAELLDNAIDEIQNGASFVVVDKISNPRDGSPCLLIQDDGGGMDPEAIRRCMSFGFSDKNSKTAIGKYGNGFKTSTMRLGADVIVFTCHVKNGKLTQSIGLLSYTYLSRKGLDRIVVPMVDYEYDDSSKTYVPLHRYQGEHFQTNLSIILHWSPYCKEVDLKKQLSDVGLHGTKVVVFNLWRTDDETLEFDFESDPEDIRLQESEKIKRTYLQNLRVLEHIGSRYRNSLRVYLSILYLRIPQHFNIILRGKIVEHHSVARDLKYPEFILYRPNSGGTKEEILTTIGFLKEAPDVNIHGFCVYHKNRLILPFWQVVSYDRSRGRGVVGVLEANFIEPTHNKQDFEKTTPFQKLEARLKEMTWEYWDYHCGLIGYQVKKTRKTPGCSVDSSDVHLKNTRHEPSYINRRVPSHQDDSHMPATSIDQDNQRKLQLHEPPYISRRVPSYQAVGHMPATSIDQNNQRKLQLHGIKRTREELLSDMGNKRNNTIVGNFMHFQPFSQAATLMNEKGLVVIKQENKKLLAKCLEYEKTKEELNHKVSSLRGELQKVQFEYDRLLSELRWLESVKPETDM